MLEPRPGLRLVLDIVRYLSSHARIRREAELQHWLVCPYKAIPTLRGNILSTRQ